MCGFTNSCPMLINERRNVRANDSFSEFMAKAYCVIPVCFIKLARRARRTAAWSKGINKNVLQVLNPVLLGSDITYFVTQFWRPTVAQSRDQIQHVSWL